MTDQIPADKVRDLRDQYARLIEDAGTKQAQAYYGHVVKDLEALLPPPSLPTLADMTEEERDGCRWMQADAGQLGRVVIVTPDKTDNLAALLDRQGNVAYGGHDTVTPRPDLPRMTWPGTEKPAPALPALPDGWRLADHETRGRVLVTRPEPDADGDVVIVGPVPHGLTRTDVSWCHRDRLTYIAGDQEEA